MAYQYPACRTTDKVEDWFGVALPDPYAWLRDGRDPEVLDFVARENAFTDQYFAARPLADKIARLKQAKLPDLPNNITPWKDGHLSTVLKDGDYVIRVLDAGLREVGGLPPIPGLEDVLIYSAEACPKDDGLLAMMVQHPGAARPSIVVCRMDDLTVLHEIHNVFSFCWSRQDGCLYYSSTQANAETQESRSVFFRYDPAGGGESVVYEDDSFSIFGQLFPSDDGVYVLASVCQDYALARWIALNTVTGQAFPLNDQPVEWKYLDTVDGGHCFITLSEADHGAVIRVENDGRRTVLLPESQRVLDGGFSAGGRLFVTCCQDVSSRLLDLSTGREVPLPSPFGALSLAGRTREGVLLSFQSFLDAPRIMSFDGERFTTLLSASEAAHPDLTVEQCFAPSAGDGVLIPYYLVRRKDARPDGSAPALMYAYGGYNISMPPWYQEMVTRVTVADWVAGGGIYVHCNLRGGNEYGPKWHEDGMGMNKRHCYEDFIGVAEELIRLGWTRAGRIGITGCSNGGLLMSALVTMRPDLWGCVIDSVPHTDMIHFAEDDRGPMYITEYGNPRASREMFQYLLSYSPYHNVRPVSYPPIYIQTGELDNNVPPYHGKKFAARMQAENRSENPVLLRVLAEGSHDRGRGEVFWRTIAEMQLFLEEHLKER